MRSLKSAIGAAGSGLVGAVALGLLFYFTVVSGEGMDATSYTMLAIVLAIGFLAGVGTHSVIAKLRAMPPSGSETGGTDAPKYDDSGHPPDVANITGGGGDGGGINDG